METKRKIVKTYEKYRENYLKYSEIVKEISKEIFKGNFLKLTIFGSILTGKYRPDSDIDIAIILKKKSEDEERMIFYKKINKRIGYLHPFEFHIISNEEWENWYKRFIKKYLEIK